MTEREGAFARVCVGFWRIRENFYFIYIFKFLFYFLMFLILSLFLFNISYFIIFKKMIIYLYAVLYD